MRRFLADTIARIFPLVALVSIVLIDAEFHGGRSLLVHGVADEVSHLLSGAIVGLGLVRLVPSIQLIPVLLGSVAMDIDHVPDVLGWMAPEGPSSRFVTHGLATVGVVGSIALVDRGRALAWISIACGLLVHLFRDAATGSIIAGWPLSHSPFTIPYAAYIGCLACIAIMTVLGDEAARSRHLADDGVRIGGKVS